MRTNGPSRVESGGLADRREGVVPERSYPRLPTPDSLFYLGGFDLPLRQARGVQTLHTAHALAESGCRVRLVVGRAPRAGLADLLADYGLRPHPRLSVLALPTVRLPKLPLRSYVHPRLAVWNWSYGLAAVAALRLLPADKRPRLVFARDPRLARLFLQARGLTGAEVIYEVHELFSTRAREPVATGPAGGSPPSRVPRLRRLEQAVFDQAARLIVLTGACKALLVEEFGVAAARVLVAPDAAAAVPAELPAVRLDGETVVYAGQLYPWKGVDTLVRALALLPRARLKIVGGLAADDPHAGRLRDLAAELGVLGRVHFRGFVPHAQVGAELAGAAVAVVPLPDNPMSRYFTSPLKLYEYMAAGLPIVASDLPSLREVLQHEQNALLVRPDDPAALAEAIGRLLADPALGERLRRQAHAAVQRWTWSERAASVLSFLSE
jgi:glycosyltransferase involved in cell wall biosynthesis